ncbi:MAG: PIG-L family deacetylase [Nitriliruptoraceae bacterium]
MTDRRLLFVHAHPDDEASKGAGTAAHYLADGAAVTLVTLTGGEAGEVLNPNADPVPPEDMAKVRAQELARAVEIIGFVRAYQLGYVDSGYHEDAADIDGGAFAKVPVDKSGRRLAAILRREQPQVVVTYPSDGGYPHPDHIMTHTVTMRAIELAADPEMRLTDDDQTEPTLGTNETTAPGSIEEPWCVQKVYASVIFPTERLKTLYEALVEEQREGSFINYLQERMRRRPGVDPDARVECGAFFSVRDDALRAHVTQVDPTGQWFEVPRGLERARYPYEAYVRLVSRVEAPLPESDLFAGIE